MRTSQTSARARLIRAGLATAAVTAVVVTGTATPAFAADVEVTVSPTTSQVGGGNTLTISGTGVFTGITAPSARFVLGASATCPTTQAAATTASPAATVTKTSDNGGTVVVPSLPTAGTYKLCLYATTANAAAIAGHAANASNTVVSAPTFVLGNTTGTSAGGSLTLTGSVGPYLSNVTAVGALFTTAGACPATYNTTAPSMAMTAIRSSASVATVTVPANMTTGTSYRVCLYNGTTVGTSTLVAAGASGSTTYTTLPGLTLSPTVGPTGGLNTITATASTSVFAGSPSPGVMFAKGVSCPATYGAVTSVVTASGVQKISNTKILLTVPASVTLDVGEATTAYTVCVYANATTGQQITTSATYTVAPVLSVTSISPSGGPAQGGSEVTITGTGFPYPADDDTVISVSLGGSPLTDVKVVSATSITGVTSAHAAGNATVTVTTAAGTKSAASPFVYSYGVTVSPKTAPTNTQVYVDILGVGFSSLTFGTGNPVTGPTGSRVFLVKDAYVATEDGSTGNWDTPPIQECTGVFPISDNEIVCQLDLGGTLNDDGTASGTDVQNGTYQIAVVKDSEPGATPAAGDVSIISSGSTFTVAPY